MIGFIVGMCLLGMLTIQIIRNHITILQKQKEAQELEVVDLSHGLAKDDPSIVVLNGAEDFVSPFPNMANGYAPPEPPSLDYKENQELLSRGAYETTPASTEGFPSQGPVAYVAGDASVPAGYPPGVVETGIPTAPVDPSVPVVSADPNVTDVPVDPSVPVVSADPNVTVVPVDAGVPVDRAAAVDPNIDPTAPPPPSIL